MSNLLNILINDTAVGVLPLSVLMSTAGNDALDVGDVTNAWVLYTKRTIEVGTPLASILGLMPNTLDAIGPLVIGFCTSKIDNPNKPDVTNLEIVTLNRIDYYVVEDELLDFGLRQCTLHSVTEFNQLWNDDEEISAASNNADMLARFILGATATGLANLAAPAVVPVPPQPGAQLPVIVAAPATQSKRTVTATAGPATQVRQPSAGDAYSFAAGFFGARAANAATTAFDQAQDKLKILLKK